MSSQSTGRPSDYTQETAAKICERLTEGESLRSICRDEAMPSIASVFRWLGAHEIFREQYALARDAQADTLADEIIEIADTPLLGITTKTDEDGKIETTEGDMIAHRRLQVDARKWIAAKLKPKKYGDRIHQEVTGKDGAPIQYEDARDRNLQLIDRLSARISSPTPGETDSPDASTDSSEPDA